MNNFVELFLGLGHYHAFFESQKYNYVNQWSQTQFAGGGGTAGSSSWVLLGRTGRCKGECTEKLLIEWTWQLHLIVKRVAIGKSSYGRGLFCKPRPSLWH